jgi:hypothetical protein
MEMGSSFRNVLKKNINMKIDTSETIPLDD